MVNFVSKLALGTANFGSDYGLANLEGKLSYSNLRDLISIAKKAGILTVDTAQAYGDSEKRLGSLLETENKIITKIGIELKESYQTNSLGVQFHKSLQLLNRDKIYGLLLHRPDVLFGKYGAAIIDELNLLKEKGLVHKIGVSIYEPNILDEIMKIISIDIVQVPFNIFDQSILLSGWSDRLKKHNVEIHARSVFLQGLLLMEQQNLPKLFQQNWPYLFENWFDFQKSVNANADEIALGFALKQPWIDKVVVGVDNVKQLKRLVEIEANNNYDFSPSFSSNDLDLINPSRWK